MCFDAFSELPGPYVYVVPFLHIYETYKPSSVFPWLHPELTLNLVGNGSSKPLVSRNSTSCSRASRTRPPKPFALSLTAKVPAMSLSSSKEEQRYVCAFREESGVCFRRVADLLHFRARLLRLVDRLISVSSFANSFW